MQMVKYFSLMIFCLLSALLDGQVSLTKPFNEPVLGDVYSKQIYDSTGTVPKNSGSNQIWDFSAFTLKPNIEVSTYIAPSMAPNGSSYSGTSFVESFGQTYFYMKSSSSKYEIVGIQNPNFKLNFSNNNATQFVWPVAFGYSGNDAFSGTANANNMNGNVTGNITTTAAGSGTLILPGGDTISDVLQVKVSLNAVASFIFGTVKANLKAVDYTYYNALNKFPLLTVSYLDASGAYTATSAVIKIHSSPVALMDHSLEIAFDVLPNPANTNVNLKFDNVDHEYCSVELVDVMGRLMYADRAGNERVYSREIPVMELPNGLYILHLKVGEKRVSRKIIKG
jgi:hypothetical protein